jgi:hypothetical protein
MKQAKGNFEAAQDSDDSAHELYYFENVYAASSKDASQAELAIASSEDLRQ